MPKPSTYFLSILIAALISLLTIVSMLNLSPNIWDTWKPATCLGTGCFCESVNALDPIRQPANTVSSLAFVFSGMIVLAQMRQNKMVKRLPDIYTAIMGIASLIIGVGSAFYHASLTFIGQFFDVFGMFLLAAFALVYARERIWDLRRTTTLSLYLTINLFLSWLQIAIPDTRRYAFAVVLVIALLFEYYFRVIAKPNIEVKPLWIGIGLLALAYVIWILDNTRLVCLESSLLQGHTVWHILGAVSGLYLYRYYASEKK